MSPRIMKVACFLAQHSPILGQPASSQTVCRPVRTNDLGLVVPALVGALTRIQSGLRGQGRIRPVLLFGVRGGRLLRPWSNKAWPRAISYRAVRREILCVGVAAGNRPFVPYLRR